MEKEDLQSLLRSFTLTSVESSSSRVPDAEILAGLEDCKRSLVGKFISRKEVVVKGLKQAIIDAWDTAKFKIIRPDRNTYQFIFDEDADKSRVLDGGPWCFDNHLLVLKEWKLGWESDPEYFDKVKYWIHVSDLPYQLYTSAMGRRIAAMFDSCEICQLREDKETGLLFYRFRVTISVKDPVRRCVRLEAGDHAEILGVVQYERIPNICFSCGHMNHTLMHCTTLRKELTVEETRKLPYGRWLKARPYSSLIRVIPLMEMSDQVPGPLLLQEAGSEDVRDDDNQNIGAVEVRGGDEAIVNTYSSTLQEDEIVEQSSFDAFTEDGQSTVHKNTSAAPCVLQNLREVPVNVSIDVNMSENASLTQLNAISVASIGKEGTKSGAKKSGFKRVSGRSGPLSDITNHGPTTGKREREGEDTGKNKKSRMGESESRYMIIDPAEAATQPRQAP